MPCAVLARTVRAHEVGGRYQYSGVSIFVARHARGDYGDDLSEEDRLLNDEAVKDGSRILSAFVLSKAQERLWCITEAQNDHGQREATTLLLSSEY